MVKYCHRLEETRGERYDALVSASANSRFDAEQVATLKAHVEPRRLEMRFVDERGQEHVVSLPIAAALELSSFISEACGFMTKLKQQLRQQPSKN